MCVLGGLGGGGGGGRCGGDPLHTDMSVKTGMVIKLPPVIREALSALKPLVSCLTNGPKGNLRALSPPGNIWRPCRPV